MLKFSDFDARGYRTVDVRTGYGEWVPTYEQTVEDAMDIALPMLCGQSLGLHWGTRPIWVAAPDERRSGYGGTAL